MNTTTASDVGMRIARRLADTLGPRRYAMWFEQSAQLDYDEPEPGADGNHDAVCHDNDDDAAGGTLRVAAANQFVADRIGRDFEPALRDAAQQELGRRVALRIEIAPERFAVAASTQAAGTQPTAASATTPAARTAAPVTARTKPQAARDTHAHTTRLRGLRHRLEDFIVGPSNQLAYAAAERLANDDVESADAGAPLFLHGGCGLGKTHLLQGICRRVLEHRPEARVLYTTGEQFTNEYITAVRTNKLERFRKWIRRLDVLAVDDVHFIANKQATQQEFLHSFDQIELGGARVVLASDSHPKLIEQFSEALISRCVRGLVVPIKPPDARTRTRLVQALAERRELHLASAGARALGQQCHGSVREIEGALTKLQALVALAKHNGQRIAEPINAGLVQQLLDQDAGTSPRTPVRFESVLEAVTDALGVSAQQVRGRGRHRMVVLARSLTIYLAREMTSMSYPEIAAALGRDNHSTVITAAQRLGRQLQGDAPVALPAHLDGETLSELTDRIRRQLRRG